VKINSLDSTLIFYFFSRRRRHTRSKREWSSDVCSSDLGVNTMFIEENNFYLDNDIQPHNYGAWKFVYENNMLLMLVSLFTIVIAAGIIAHEFRWGTIKLLLIRPISRSTILLSKYIRSEERRVGKDENYR